MAQKPANLTYGLTDRPKALVTFLLALQHISLIAIGLVFSVIIVRETGGEMESAVRFVSASMLAGGIVVILQSLKKGPVGSGYLCPGVCGPSYFAASLLAAKTGGLSLVFGMTAIAALFEGILAKVMRHLRILFPAEVTGLIVLMVGLTVVKIASINFFGINDSMSTFSLPSFYTALVTLAIMVGLNVWSKGKLKLFCALIGMVAGYILSIVFGILAISELTELTNIPIVALPFAGHPGWSFDISLLLPFLVAVLCSSLKTVGDITTCQRINDVDWKRPDMDNISKGLLADGSGALIAGIVGGFGQSSSSSNIGLSIATGATSRIIAKWIGILLIIMSLFPYTAMVFVAMPAPVMGATLLFALSFMVVAGMQIIMSRMMDGRKTFVVGLSLVFGLSIDIVPYVYAQAPSWISPVVSSSLAGATIMAVTLNLLFRLGIAQSALLKITPDINSTDAVFSFMERQGGLWGARHEVIQKATFAICESLESIFATNSHNDTSVAMNVRFDEYNLDVTVEYQGTALVSAQERPSNEAI
ncbi:MAG: solute carrier family 23 protein, partial [Thermodesulfobacteriota bacterium]|nr:solute carrier family 23 protein [Thermodesulfobacteriota bacterium]